MLILLSFIIIIICLLLLYRYCNNKLYHFNNIINDNLFDEIKTYNNNMIKSYSKLYDINLLL